jgi:hypothetical protein
MIIFTDLDGTLAHAAWRAELMHDWDAYHAASVSDKPNKPMIAMINALSKACGVVCITSRPERWRQLTNDWLLKHGLLFHDLLMLPDDDRRKSPPLKVDLALQFIKSVGAKDVIAIDDRADVIAAYQKAGFTTLLAQEV